MLQITTSPGAIACRLLYLQTSHFVNNSGWFFSQTQRTVFWLGTFPASLVPPKCGVGNDYFWTCFHVSQGFAPYVILGREQQFKSDLQGVSHRGSIRCGPCFPRVTGGGLSTFFRCWTSTCLFWKTSGDITQRQRMYNQAISALCSICQRWVQVFYFIIFKIIELNQFISYYANTPYVCHKNIRKHKQAKSKKIKTYKLKFPLCDHCWLVGPTHSPVFPHLAVSTNASGKK